MKNSLKKITKKLSQTDILLISLVILISIYIFKDTIKQLLFKSMDNDNRKLSKEEKEIYDSQSGCPMMIGSKTKISQCVQYPPLNTGFIISACCDGCTSVIQNSFNKADNQWTIRKIEDSEHYGLYNKDEITHRQLVLKCSKQNMDMITKLIGTKFVY
jgi:hypothetical protein